MAAIVNLACFLSRAPARIGFEAAMAGMVTVSILGILAIAALVWCFLGFTRALYEPPGLSGRLFHLQQDSRNARRRQATVLEFPLFPSTQEIAAGREHREKAGGIRE